MALGGRRCCCLALLFVEQLLAELVHLALDLVGRVALLAHQVLHLDALELDLALAVVREQLGVALAIRVRLELGHVLVRLVLDALLDHAHIAQIARHVAIGARAARRL